jgi:hypothetical protein
MRGAEGVLSPPHQALARHTLPVAARRRGAQKRVVSLPLTCRTRTRRKSERLATKTWTPADQAQPHPASVKTQGRLVHPARAACADGRRNRRICRAVRDGGGERCAPCWV